MYGTSSCCRTLLLLLLLLVAGDVLRPARAQATLRAPGAPQSDGRIIIGGTAINGKPAFLAQYESIFTDYLNAALGATLGKTFVTVAIDIDETVEAVAGGQLDFIFSYPSLFTCFSAQFGARVVASVQSSRRLTTPPYAPVPLSFFGGVFFTLANRSDIASLADIAGKRLEGADVTSMAAGQAHWYELMTRGLSFWNLPSQMVFTGNQYSVVSDVFAGHTDVGMVRSDLLEGLQLPAPYCNATAEAAVGLACYPAGTFKIIGPRLQAGYPFNTSTQLWPEWPVAALAHVELDTQKAVAEALFAFGRSAVSLPYVIPGRVASFTPSLDYVAVRDMQHAQALVVNGTCLTASQVFDSILCMPGTFRRSRNAIDAECLARGLVCPAGQACVCSPCATLPPVPLSMSISLASSANVSECARMQLCLQPAQNLQLVLTVTDEWFDARAELGLPPVTQVELRYSEATLITANQNSIAVPKDGDGVWSLRVAPTNTGLFIIEAFADGVALDMSPTLLSIVSPTCAGNDASADASGACVCAKRHVASGPNGDCVAVPAFSVAKVAGGSAGGAAALVLIIVAVVVIMHRRNEALWRIPRDAVTFMEPSEVLGRGTFGMVLKGKYRGTTVALKRSLALEPRTGRAMVDSEISAASIHLQLQFNMHAASRDGGPAPPEMPSLDSLTNKIPETPAGVRCSGSGGCASRSNSATGTSSILPVICAGFCPALDSVLFGLWQRKKAASLRTDFIREMRLLVHLRHPHILTVLGAVLHESEPILVMEHMDRGSLHDLLHNETLPLEGDVVLQLLRDVVSGMQFLHSADPPILHNDLKAANILVDASFRAKVADFGLSGKRRASRGPPGTPYWMAPELLRDSKPRIMPSTATDVYSFGITLSEVFTRCEPYVEDQGSMDDVLALISALPKPGGPPPKRPSILDIVPPFFQDLMRRCWHAEPAVRPSMSAIAAELNVMADQEGVGAATVTAALTAAKHRHAGERKLLNAMFPPAVARALAEGRRVEAQEFPCVTVFFSDIVGFTDMTASMAPAKVMTMLDRLYQAFDALTAQHGLFKVETIGDAYMACGNLVGGQDADHAARVAAFALEAVAVAATIRVDADDAAAGVITIRAGFHCGPVIASVVGRTNPRYCLFGDTVNCANRMESNSLPGRVTASHAAAELLRQQQPSAQLVSRGPVAIKGKGLMELFWLLPNLTPTPQARNGSMDGKGGTRGSLVSGNASPR